MMDTVTIFATVSLMMLANGVVLAIVSHDFPSSVRPAAKYWQLGTLLIAGGCATFAIGGFLPRPIMLVAANGMMAFGLTGYYAAVQLFDGRRPKAWQLIPAIANVVIVFWFSVVEDNFHIRLLGVGLTWILLFGGSAWALRARSPEQASSSRTLLRGFFVFVLVIHTLRVIAYMAGNLSSNFAIESNANWLNIATPIVLTLLPVVGTTAFLLLCNDRLRRQLETAASTDYLTGLPNRRTLAKEGRSSFSTAENLGAGFAVAVFDIDNFKVINDTYGHDVGDEVLVRVARYLQEQVAEGDMVVRTGGEEFAVLLNDHVAAPEAAEKMRRAVAQACLDIGNRRIAVTISAGVAIYRQGDEVFEDMLRRADHALYAAKASGRNRVELGPLTLVPGRGSTRGNDLTAHEQGGS